MTRRSSVLYTVSSLDLIARLGGAILGAWLLKYGAASVLLLGVTLTSTIIPILSFLPYSAARSPKLEELRETPMAGSLNCPSDGSPRANSPRFQPDHSNVKDPSGPEQPLNSPQQELMATKWSRRAISNLIRRFSYVPFDNPVYPTYLAIMFLNGLAMDVRNQLRPWTSKRYDWPLATVGYILSVENFLGVGILFALPWLDRVCQSRSLSSPTASSADEPLLSEEEASVLARSILAKRRREILVARVSLGLGAVGAVVLAFAATRGVFIVGLGIMTGAVGFPDAIRAFFTSHFETDDIQGLYASVTVVETLSTIMGSPAWGSIYAHAYQGANAWTGAPFGVCAVLLVCTLGLVLAFRV